MIMIQMIMIHMMLLSQFLTNNNNDSITGVDNNIHDINDNGETTMMITIKTIL